MRRPPHAARPATIDDVARSAGVSRATVSRVMNGNASVDAALASRVQEAAAALRYQPSTTARSLSLGRTHTVAVVVPELSNPMVQEVLQGVSDAAQERGYRVLVADTGGDPETERASSTDARRRCDALVLVAPRLPEPALRELLGSLAPVVVVNRLPDGVTPTVGVDYAAGTDLLVEHLLGLGHRHLAYLAGPPLSESNRTRVATMRRAAERHAGVRLSEIGAGATIESGYRAGEAVLATRATAVVAYNDLVAFGLLARLNELGVAVPADISVAGFDDVPLARFAVPPLTTVGVSHAELGATAWRQLAALLDGADRTDPPPRVPTLRPRASTGVVPATVRSPERDRRPEPADPPPRLASVSWTVRESSDGAEHVLLGALPGGRTVDLCHAVDGAAIPPVHSPRPYLHPVRTAGGAELTDRTPADHRHHYGVSMAVALVNGTSFWGGRTWVRGEGPTLLANHGTQVLLASEVEGERLRQRISWTSPAGEELLREDRTITVAPDELGWRLRWRSDLHAPHADAVVESPATAGRRGAGYGGVFWRLGPASRTAVLAAHGEGEEAVHGSISPWVAFVQHRGPRVSTLLLAQRPDHVLPWFLRASDYVGAGPALAWDTPLTIARGETATTELAALLTDTALTPEQAATTTSRLW